MPFPSLDPIAHALTREGVTALCDDALKEAQTLADGIQSLTDTGDEALTWDSTFGAFDRMTAALQEAGCVPALMMVAHPEAEVREAAATCEPKIEAFVTARYLNAEIAEVLKRAARALGEQPVEGGRAKFVEDTLRDYRRNGLELDQDGQARLRTLNEAITKAGQAFEKNLAETTLTLDLRPEQLEGLPEEYVAAHPADEHGRVRVTTDYPDLVPFLKYATDREAAKDLYGLSQSRAVEKNKPLLDELLKLRHEKAKLLGYVTWSDYVLEPRMAKNAAAVKAFLQDLHAGVKPKREEEFAHYRTEAEKRGLLKDGCVRVSDAAYLEDRVVRQSFSLDSRALREYFDIRAVERGIMDIASALYGISFELADDPVWHADVRAFHVKDGDGSLLGRAYMDLYPRDGKYKHAAMFGLRETMRLADGSRQVPAAALVCNFPKPADGAPALLSHDEVTTFFHEFGHLLHHLVSQSPLASVAGTSVARDFVESPSQMFEEWAWDRGTLNRFARHYKTGALLPDAMVNALTASRAFGEALHTERQIFLATLDQAYHTAPPVIDTTRVVEELHPEYSPFVRIPDTCFQATFGHLVGYDAAYYGYQWARSLAFDLLTRFKTEGLMNPQTARDYRRCILEPGATLDAAALVTRFLGRAPNAEAYKRFLGIG